MKKIPIMSVAWMLMGLLAVAGLITTLGHQQGKATPLLESYDPSGVAAFGELISRSGHPITFDRSTQPRLGPKDVAVVCSTGGSSDEGEEAKDTFKDSVMHFVQTGGRVLVLDIPEDFDGASKPLFDGAAISVKSINGEQRRVTNDGQNATFLADDQDTEGETALWNADATTALVIANSKGKGSYVEIKNGLLATNRFLDKADNADVLMGTLNTILRPGDRVVFAEGGIAGHARGLFETIGAWVEAAWYQVLFLFGVIIFTMGKRFGLPEVIRSKQRGSRELLDAIADTYQRANASEAGLAAALTSADAELRRVLKIPRDASRNERDRLLPDSLSLTLARMEVALGEDRIPPGEAVKMIIRLQNELDSFLGTQTRRPRKRKVA